MPPAQSESLVDELVKELQEPKPIGQPIILEDPLFGEDAIRVHVVWDRWQHVPSESQTEIILSAYSAALGKDYRNKIKLAVGMTVPEAANVGLLPFQLIPSRTKRDGPSDEEYRKAMVDSGASLLFGEDGPQLRFATLDDAEAAMEHFQEVLPKSRWFVAQEFSGPFPSAET